MQIPNRKKTIFLTGSAKVAVSGATKTTSHRCLDAAHGKTVNPKVARERPRQIGLSPETARTDLIAGKCGRDPTTPGHADAFQGSRVTETVARSRHKEQSLKRLRRKVRNNGFTTKSMRSPRPEFRAQPAGHACGPPLRDAAARTARRTRQRRRRNHPPGPVAGRGAPVGASRPRVQGRFFTSFRMTKRRGATQGNRIANIRPSFRDGTTSGRQQQESAPEKRKPREKASKKPQQTASEQKP
jgi:hypothetical protein